MIIENLQGLNQKEIEEKARKKIKEGWIRCSMLIDVLALNEIDLKEALQEHVDKMKKEDKTLIYGTQFKPITKIENPLQGVKEGYSCIVQLWMVVRNLDKLVTLAMNYGPTNIEVYEPKDLTVSTAEAQIIVNSVADIVHLFARHNKGGIPLIRKKAEEAEEEVL